MALHGEGYDPLSHLSTPLSLLPRTLAGVGFSLPVGLSEVDQIDAFFHHMHGVLQKDPKSGIISLEKSPGPNPRTREKERDEAGKRCSAGQKQDCKLASLESTKTMQQSSIRGHNSRLSPNPDTIDRDGTGRSFEGQQVDVKLESLESMLEQQSYMNNHANELSALSDSLQIKRCKPINSNQEQNWDVELMELQTQCSISSHVNKLMSSTNRSVLGTDNAGKHSSKDKIGDTNFESVKATMMEQRPSIISNAIANKLSNDNTKMEMDKAGSVSFGGQKQSCSSESVEFTDKEQRHSETICVSERSPNRDSMVQKKDESRKINSEEKNDMDFRSVDSMLESGLGISGGSHNPREVLDKTEMERDISVKNSSHPEQMVESKSKGQRPRRPGLGLNYNISPFAIIEKPEKAVQVVPVDFTVLDHISDPNAFTKKAYELEAAVKEIKRLGCQPKIIGERVFRMVEDDQPRERRPGLGLQMPQPKFIPLPMRPLPAKPAKVSWAYQSRAPTQRNISRDPTKVKALPGSQNEAPSNISNSTEEVPETNLHINSHLQKLLSNLESCPDDDEKAVAMVFDLLNLRPTVIPPLVVPEMPKFSRINVIRSPWGQLPSIERVRELKGEDPLVAFEELRKKIFTASPAADYSDDDTSPLVGVDSFRSPSMSPGCEFNFENEEIDTPSLAGPSRNPNGETEEFPCQEKVPEMTSDARGDNNFSDEDIAGDYIPDEPEMGSPWDNSPVNIENSQSSMPLENSPVNGEVAPSNIVLENHTEDGGLKETSSKIGKKRGLEHADSEIPTPTSDSNAKAQAETSLLEPPKDRDEQKAPPKKKTKKQERRRSSIRIVEGGLREVNGVRRSTRIRSRPLRHWMGERFLYGRIEDNIISAVGVKECSPATLGVRVKVRSFVSDKHADLVARIAK